MTTTTEQVWRTRGFDAFRAGTFGNAGQNLYVSRTGVLQRIQLFDLNRDGYVDLLFCNAQDHHESPRTYVYHDVLGACTRRTLPSAGSPTGVLADLSGDGYLDLVIGMEKSGAAGFHNAHVFFGGAEGLGEKHMLHLPAHFCLSATTGDFNGDGRRELAFMTQGRLRIFTQTELGFEAHRFADLDVSAQQIGAADLDGDGRAELIATFPDGPMRVYWGGDEGIDPDRYDEIAVGDATDRTVTEMQEGLSVEEAVGAVAAIVNVIDLDGVPHVFVPYADRVFLVPVASDRRFGEPLIFPARRTVAVAAGDITGDGTTDLVFAGRDDLEGTECCWIYWGGPGGYSAERRTALPSHRACDVVVADLDGNGHADVVICQYRDDEMFTFHSQVIRGGPGGITGEPIRLETLGARRVLVGRTDDDPNPQIVFINHRARNANGSIDSYIYFGGPDGFDPNRRAELSGRGATGGVACDFNDDGLPDIAIMNSAENAQHLDPGSFVFYGRPDGFRREPDIVVPTTRAWHHQVADVYRRGYLDLVISMYYDSRILVFRGTDDGFDLEKPDVIDVKGAPGIRIAPRRIVLGDINRDGWLDLVVAPIDRRNAAVLWGGPDGFRADRMTVLPAGGGSSCCLHDLNGNGWLDLIIGSGPPTPGLPHDAWVTIYWNGPDGFQPHRRSQLIGQKSIGMAVADFNNDGHLDLFMTAYKSAVERDIDAHIYWGGPDGFSDSRRQRIRAHSSVACFVADFNEDGYLDVALANHKTFNDHVGDSWVLWNGPDGISNDRFTALPARGPHGMYNNQPRNILTNGEEEYYTSTPFRLPDQRAVSRIGWDADLGPKTWVRAQLRFAPDDEGLERAPWSGPSDDTDWFENDEPVDARPQAGQWVQYRLALGATNGGCTPRVTEVRVYYE